MITKMWGVNNEMINQIKPNTVIYHSWTPQDNILMSEANDEHWDSKFFVTFNSEDKIYNINNRF